jgi:DNA-binding MarR family transcriptional regulator
MTEKNKSELDILAEDMVEIIPLFHKKLLCDKKCHVKPSIVSPKSKVLCILDGHDMMPISEIGKKLFLSKPHMSSLVDKLIEEGLVKRMPNKEDRRIINLKITDKGRRYVKEVRQELKDYIKSNVASLSKSDISSLCRSLENVKKILTNMES